MIISIAAVARGGVIGNDGRLPWRIPEEMKHFSRTTKGHTLIMGRRTYESIGAPLPNRRTIVVTRTGGFEDVEIARSLEEAIERAAPETNTVFLCGGASIYAEGMEHADALYVSWIDEDHEGDTYFPTIGPEWIERRRDEHERFTFVEYRKAWDVVPPLEAIESHDAQTAEAIRAELERQNTSIELIASENFVSSAVMRASGSVLTNKYAEGYPGRRYYGGCEHVDTIERLARERLTQLYRLPDDWTCNVQPHSGSQANMAVCFSLLEPGDRILGMDLSAGGHLTHGLHVNYSGKLYDAHSYPVDETGRIDYEAVLRIAREIKPKLIIAGASAYARTIDFDRFREIADDVDAYLHVDMAHIAGLVAAGLHPSPFPHAHVVTSTTHKTLRGPRGGLIIARRDLMKKLNSAIFPGSQGGPLMHQIAAKAVAFGEALDPSFTRYQERIVENAQAMARVLLDEGIELVTGGTDTHLLLLDLRSLDVTGADAERLLESVGLTTNKNGVPNDPQPPKITSGIRIGTPAITTRGFTREDAEETARLIALVLKDRTDDAFEDVRRRVAALCAKHPLYALGS